MFQTTDQMNTVSVYFQFIHEDFVVFGCWTMARTSQDFSGGAKVKNIGYPLVNVYIVKSPVLMLNQLQYI